MKIRRHIDDYNFIADQESGMTFRWGKTFNDNPSFAPIPELVDISISNHCTKGCDFCYRNSRPDNSFMSIVDYEYALDCLNHPTYGNVFQVALGGGEPLEHPDFIELLNITKDHNIVPNFTTNGGLLTPNFSNKIRNKVGAVAVSINNLDNIDYSNIAYLIETGIRTNIHYVIDNNNICQAIKILKGEFNYKLSGINAIVFLTFKPSGRGDCKNILRHDPYLDEFLRLVDNSNCSCNIGFDACFVPLLMRFTQTRHDFIDSCEVGFFSVYIDEKLNVTPCSFSNGNDSFNLRSFEFYDIWLNKFSEFRNRIENKCTQVCPAKIECKGKCAYYPEVTVCYKV